MALLNRLKASWSAPSVSDDGHWTTLGGHGVRANSAGMVITEDQALSIPTVFGCVKILKESVGQIPFLLYDRIGDDGRERASGALAYRLNDQPNDDQTAFEFRREMQQTACFYEYAYAEVEWRGTEPIATPRHPSRIARERTAAGLRYSYLEDDGVTRRPILATNMLRVPGQPTLRYAGETLGQAMALERYATRLFGYSPRPTLAIQAEKGVVYDDPAKKRIKEALIANRGEYGDGITWIPEGLQIAPWGMTAEQAQYMALRSGIVAEVTRWWRIPPYMVGLLESGTVSYASVSTQGVDFVVYCLMPWLVGWEQAVGRDLIIDKRGQFAEFLASALLRGTTKERYEVYKVAIENGIMSVNEVRRLENLNPRAGGDAYLMPLNMAPAARHVEAGSPADRLLQALTRDAASAVLHKEQGSLARLAEAAGDDPAAWERGVREFYGRHAAYVADKLKVPMPAAVAYAAMQEYGVLSEGPGVVATWNGQVTDRLINLALAEGVPEVTAA